LQDHPLSVACSCLLNIFTAPLFRGRRHPRSEDATCRGYKEPPNTVTAQCSVSSTILSRDSEQVRGFVQ